MTSAPILGIDPGLAVTGYAIIESKGGNRSFQLLESGAIRTESKNPTPERLQVIYQEVCELVEEYSPNTVAVEEIFFGQNKKTAGMVAQARGVILLASEGTSVEGYSPLQVKKTVTGHGRANKEQMKMMVKRLLNLQTIPKPDDAADAIGIALCGGLNVHSAVPTSSKRNSF